MQSIDLLLYLLLYCNINSNFFIFNCIKNCFYLFSINIFVRLLSYKIFCFAFYYSYSNLFFFNSTFCYNRVLFGAESQFFNACATIRLIFVMFAFKFNAADCMAWAQNCTKMKTFNCPRQCCMSKPIEKEQGMCIG